MELGAEENHASREHTEAGNSSAKEEEGHEEFEKEFEKEGPHGTCSAGWQKEPEEKKEVSELNVTFRRVSRCFV